MSKYFKVMLLLTALFLTIGCAGQASVKGSSTSLSVPSEQVPVASVEGNHAEISKSTYNRMVGDTLYFIDSRWDEEEKKLKNISVCRLQRGSEQSEILTDLGDAELISFFADETKAVYCFYTESEEETEKFYLRKMNQDKEVAYDVEVSYEGISGGEGPLVRIGTVAAGEADREGKVCLAGTQGDLYLFNEEGQIVRIEKAPWDGDTYNGSTCGLVNAGENGIYTWLLNGRKLSLQKVNMENGTLGKVIEVNVEGTPNVTLTLYNGYDHGILIDDSDSLWCYLPGQGAPEHILNWGDSTIGLKQYTIDAISVFDKGIITRHLKNGANLHETATIGETQSGGFFCDMAGVHWGPSCFGYQGGLQQTPAIPPAKSNYRHSNFETKCPKATVVPAHFWRPLKK